MALLNQIPEGFTTTFSDSLAQALKDARPNELASVTLTDLSVLVQRLIPAALPPSLSLERTRPDYESVMAQLITEVTRTNDWADAGIAGVGQMLMRMVAADVDFGQFSIARSLQEAFPDVARSDNSVFLASRMLGNRITRKRPCQVEIQLTRQVDFNTILQIPAWTQFAVSGSNLRFFNRDLIQFNQNDITKNVRLYEGSITSTSVISLGNDWSIIEAGSETGNISDIDVRIFVNDEQWTKVDDPLWHYQATDKVCFENTTPNSNISVLFGNSKTAAAPPSGSTVRIEWVETLGPAAASPLMGLTVQVLNASTNFGTLIGITTSGITGGVDAADARFFRLFGGNRRAAQKRAVRRSDYRAQAVNAFPGVYDAYFKGQAETFPNKPSYMNIVHAVLLTDPVFSDTQWIEFKAFMRKVGIFQTEMIREDPTPVLLDVVADVAFKSDANLADCERILVQAIVSALKPTYGSLGYSWYRSDVVNIIKNDPQVKDLVEYIVLRAPSADTVVTGIEQWVKLNTVRINATFTRRGSYDGRLDAKANVIAVYDSNGKLIVD